MDAERLKALLDEQTPQIIAEVRAKVVERVSADLERQIAELSLSEVKKHFAEHVGPQIAKALIEENGAILEAVKQGASQISIALAQRMTEVAAENLTRTRNVRDITNKLFG